MVTRRLIGFVFVRNRGKHNKNLYTAVQRIRNIILQNFRLLPWCR